MAHARIRWRNVGRLAAGAGAVALLLAFLPQLLEPPKPPPLPADVGLASSSAWGELPPADSAARPRRPAPQRDGGRPAEPPHRDRRHRHDPPSPKPSAAPTRAAGSAPGPSPAPPTPVASQPTPEPAPTPAPPPVADPPPPPPAGGSAPAPDRPPAGSEFGFER